MTNTRQTKYGTECTLEWDKLTLNECGRFCDHCQKPVIDFTGWERDAMVSYMKQNPKTCGKFNIGQIDPSIIKPINFRMRPRILMLAALSAFGMSGTKALQSKIPLETVQLPFVKT